MHTRITCFFSTISFISISCCWHSSFSVWHAFKFSLNTWLLSWQTICRCWNLITKIHLQFICKKSTQKHMCMLCFITKNHIYVAIFQDLNYYQHMRALKRNLSSQTFHYRVASRNFKIVWPWISLVFHWAALTSKYKCITMQDSLQYTYYMCTKFCNMKFSLYSKQTGFSWLYIADHLFPVFAHYCCHMAMKDKSDRVSVHCSILRIRDEKPVSVQVITPRVSANTV